MTKVNWNKDKIIYFYSKREQYYLKGFFKLKRSEIINGIEHNLKEDYMDKFEVIDDKQLLIRGSFKYGDILDVDGIEYKYEKEPIIDNDNKIDKETAIKNNKENKDNKENEHSQISFAGYKIEDKSNDIFIIFDEKTDEEIKVLINEYTREIYPDYPYNSFEKTIKPNNKVLIYSVPKGIISQITLVTASNEKMTIEYENVPLYYFSNVASLREKIKQSKLGINQQEYSDEKLKQLVTEKSIFLKKRFGLTKNEVTNIELFPAFKELVNLYCLRNLLSFSFIQGNPTVKEDGAIYNDKELRLGKYKVAGDDTSAALFGPKAINEEILILEKDLKYSLYNKPTLITKQNNHLLSNIQECNPLMCSYYLKKKIIHRESEEIYAELSRTIQ